jgi:hypothetical protein
MVFLSASARRAPVKNRETVSRRAEFSFFHDPVSTQRKKLILTGLTLIIPKKKVKHFSILSRDSNGLILWVPFTFGNATGSSPQQSSQLQLREQEDTCHGKK